MASKLPNGPDYIDRIALDGPDTRRMYLRAGNQLSTTPGMWMLPEGQASFPSDTSSLAGNLVTVPVRSDQSLDPGTVSPPYPPPASDIRSWTGTFSGTLISAPNQQVTRFTLYTNQALFPGWQQDPTMAGNSMTVRFVYDFNSDGEPDRPEVLQNAPLSTGNAFMHENKITEYVGDRLFSGPIGRVSVFVGQFDNGRIIRNAQFPSAVTNGTLTVQLYGGSNPNTPLLHPYFVSEEASPLTNRASWVKPPYETTLAHPGSQRPDCASTVCLKSAQYFASNVQKLPQGIVGVAGRGYVRDASTSNAAAMSQILTSSNGALNYFNQQYVALQLSLLESGAPSSEKSNFHCYNVNVPPVKLSTLETISSTTTIEELLDHGKRAAQKGNLIDLRTIAQVMRLLNGDDPGGRCRSNP